MHRIQFIFSISYNTLREIFRDRILYVLIAFSLLLIGLSLALGHLSFFEKFQITTHLGFSIIQLTSTFLAIFLGGVLIHREVDKRTILTLLARPIHRWEFLLGKALGLFFVIVIIITGLSFILFLTLKFFIQSPELNLKFFISSYGILLEAPILISFSMLFSSFTRLFFVISSSTVFYIIGHSIHTLYFFTKKSESNLFVVLSKILTSIFPDLEKFNWRSLIVYSESLPLKDFLFTTFYSLSWSILLMSLALFIIQRRSFD